MWQKMMCFKGLKNATCRCAKGAYDKGPHSFSILARIDPGKVMAASLLAKRLIETLSQLAT